MKKKHLIGLLFLILLGVGLQNIPGTYTLDEIDERVELDSLEGKALMSLGRTEVDAAFYFKQPTRHRISRNAELQVPADTRLTLHGVMLPEREDGEIVLKPDSLELRSDRPLVFIYRNVTVARARLLRTDEEGTLRAVGYYQLLSALRTGSRYQRQREIRRDYQIPTEASMNLSVQLKELEPMVNTLLGDSIPDSFDLGSLFRVQLNRFHHLQFSDNHLDLHVDGKVHSAQSKRVSQVFSPSFRARLGVDVQLPREQLLSDAAVGVSLKQIHTLDFNRSNPVFDKMIRDLARSYRDEARIEFHIAEEVPEIAQWPGELFIEDFNLRGEKEDDAEMQLRIHWKKTDPLLE
ncbi:MAG: hypothetical protein PF795_14295 [Kiritimatiellae bacterium]|jgi:hypothetical protein|nr:hypothetical protein [Kiritimatiellia bacterium]